MNEAIFAKVKEIIVDKLNVDPAQVVPGARFREDLKADSLDLVELIMAFEENSAGPSPMRRRRRSRPSARLWSTWPAPAPDQPDPVSPRSPHPSRGVGFSFANPLGAGATAGEKLTQRRQDAEALRRTQRSLAPFASLRQAQDMLCVRPAGRFSGQPARVFIQWDNVARLRQPVQQAMLQVILQCLERRQPVHVVQFLGIGLKIV